MIKRDEQFYRKLGFGRLAGSRGGTGHNGCDRFFQREL